jgi:hypothetical protein
MIYITYKNSMVNGKEGEAFYTTKFLRRDISSIKKSEVKIGRFVNSILKKK